MKRPAPLRVLMLVLAVAALALIARAETWTLCALMLAPLLDLWPADDPAERRRRYVTRAVMLALAVGASYAIHSAMRGMLGGAIRPAEVAFNAWVIVGFLATLDYLDRGLRRIIARTKLTATAHAARLLIVVLVALAGAAALMQSVRVKLDYELPREARAMNPQPFAAESVGGVTVRGYFFDRGSPVTLVIAHGIGAHAQNFMPYLTRQLRDQRVNGLIFDFRGHGYSDGHVSSFGAREADDLRAALRWLEAEHPDRARRIIFYGFSMGSAAAIPVAADHPRAAGLIVDSGFAKLTDMAAKIGHDMPAGLGNVLLPIALPIACAITQSNLYDVVPERDLARIDFPILVLHGSDDALIPLERGQRLMAHPKAQGVVVPRGDHTNLPSADPGYFDRVGRYIELIVNDEPLSEDEPRDPPALVAPTDPDDPRE